MYLGLPYILDWFEIVFSAHVCPWKPSGHLQKRKRASIKSASKTNTSEKLFHQLTRNFFLSNVLCKSRYPRFGKACLCSFLRSLLLKKIQSKFGGLFRVSKPNSEWNLKCIGLVVWGFSLLLKPLKYRVTSRQPSTNRIRCTSAHFHVKKFIATDVATPAANLATPFKPN